MKSQTRQRFNKFKERMAEVNGVPADEVGTVKFTVAPSVQQKLVARIQEDDDFLKAINIIPVDEQSGQKLGLGIGTTIAGRANTAGGTARTGVDPTGWDDDDYKCVQTNFDTKLTYAKLDMWAKFPNFQPLIQGLIVTRQALDRIMIGFNGTSAAAQTDRAANPLLQDVNVGWLQKIRLKAPAHVMGAVVGGKVAGKVSYGSDGDFASLDAMVYGAKEKMLPVYARRAPGLCVIVGDDLLYDKYGAIMEKTEGSLDTLARAAIMADKQLGGLPVVRVPFFPADAFLITTLNNLSIYYQDGKVRRHIKDQPELDQVTDFQSSNEAYVVEDYNFVGLVENIVRNDRAEAEPDAEPEDETGGTGTGGSGS